jgi:beta-mannosidase
MSWKNYTSVFDRMLKDIVSALHDGCDYWPSSPHTPHGDRHDFNNPSCGDAHLWAVWHEGKPFEWYRTCEHRFNSEFGFQSLPEPKTVYGFTNEGDRNIMSFVMEQHQRSHGNATIMEYMLQWFRAPDSFESTLWLSQILQGMSIKYAVEHWRRMMPRGMGTLYWQLNDCWPVASWSSIDYHGRWKALHYMARHFFAPLMVSGIEDVAKGTVDVYVTSDLLEPVKGVVKWVATDIDGKVLRRGARSVRAESHSSSKVQVLRLMDLTELHEKRGLLIWLEFSSAGRPVSRNMVFFARPIKRPRIFSPRPRHLDLCLEPGLSARAVRKKDGSFEVTLVTERPALWVWLELAGVDAEMSDNFFHLRPGISVKLSVCPARTLSLAEMRKHLIVRSLVDTF